jgi:STE24 endopeptidase
MTGTLMRFATLTPDPMHSLFHDSHPPASQRIARPKPL